MRYNLTLRTATVFLFTSCSLIASNTSFAGYIQASNNQDFALLSTSIGDNSFNVTFSAYGQLYFSYFAQGMKESATLNMVDNNIFQGASHVSATVGTFDVSDPAASTAMAGTFSVSDPTDSTFSLDGTLFVLPPTFADIPNIKLHPVAQVVVPDDAVVNVSSLLPVSVSTGCASCGVLPIYDSLFTPAPAVAPPLRLSPFAAPFSLLDDTEPAPEPATAALFGIALLGAGLFQLKRR